MGEAQYRAKLNAQAFQSVQQAADLYQALGDVSGQGRALWGVASGYNDLGHSEESRHAAQAAQALCQLAGDQYGIGNALNVLTFTEADLAAKLRLLSQARQAFEAAGYLERQTAVVGNLGLAYGGLGLYRRSRRLQLETSDIDRRIGARLSLAIGLANLADLEVRLGHLDAARGHLANWRRWR